MSPSRVPAEFDGVRPVFVDPDLQEEFDRTGYVRVPLLDAEQVSRLRDWYLLRCGEEGPNPPGAYNDTYAEFSVIHSWPEFRREAYEHICSVLCPLTDRILVDYRPLVANYVNKPPGTGVVPIHQNWSVVDENRYQSVSVWVALVDCDVDNGAMYLLDGSHRRLRGPRGMWSYASFADADEETVAAYLTPVPVRAGEAVILDDAVVHYSPPNRTPNGRLAIQFVMVPDEAQALFHQVVDETTDHHVVDRLGVSPEFFFEFWHGDGDERFVTSRRRLEVPKALHDLRELAKPTGGRGRSRRWLRRTRRGVGPRVRR